MAEHNIDHNKRNPVLDTLRGLAIITIILHHSYLPARTPINNIPDYTYSIFLKLLVLFTRGGWVAVDLFFVLSGFLVSGLLFNEYKKSSTVDIRNFLVRRSFKIYPAFIFFIAITLIGETLLNKTFHYHPIDYLKDLLFLHNYLGGRWGQTWSLDVEEFFYLILPFIFYYLIKKKAFKFNSFISAYFFLLIVGMICRYLVTLKYPYYNFEKQYTATHFRLDGLFLGVLISYIYNFRAYLLMPVLKNRIVLGTIFTLVISLNFFVARSQSWQAILLPAINAIAFGVLLIICLETNLLKNKILSYLGKSSYSIYLWHSLPNYYANNFMERLTDLYHTNPKSFNFYGLSYKEVYIAYFLFYVLSSVALGIFFTKIIEEPFLRVRNRFSKRQTNIIVTNVSAEE